MNMHEDMTVSAPVRRVHAGTVLVLAALLTWTTLAAPLRARAAETSAPADTIPAIEVEKNGWLAAGETVGLNLLIWSYDRYVREGGTNPGFRIGFDSWEENFKNGFECGGDAFWTETVQ